MRANLDAAGGYPLSEGVMLALARYVGKQKAHEMIHALAAAARLAGCSFSEAVRSDAAISRLLTQDEIDSLLSADAQLGQCRALVDRLLEAAPKRSAP